MEAALYYPTEEELRTLGFSEGYGELWICPCDNDASALIGTDERGTTGYIVVNQKITHEEEINDYQHIINLVRAAKAPF